MTTITVWVMMLYIVGPASGYSASSVNPISTMTVDNIATQAECEAKIVEARQKLPIKTAACMSFQKIK